MTRLSAILLALATTACNTASPGFRGADPVKVEIDGNRYQVRQVTNLAEVIRTNPTALPRFSTIGPQAQKAAAQVTGCKPSWITGDTNLMILGLSCNGEAPPPKPKKRKTTLCEVIDSYTSGGAVELQIGCLAG